ncbi:MAG TPA: PQQ-binding-like beta-propeller repeat protein [Tepidisphaeraceae bacterium]|jgi:outer membrane protein assembly factor BamB
MKIGKRLATAFVLAGLGLLGGSLAGADIAKDWPQFRGPARDNVSHETGLLKEWPKAGPPLAWKVKTVGNGYATVSIANGRIFTAGKIDDASYVIALKEDDGSQLWKAKIGPGSDPDHRGPGPRATPTVDGDSVYALGETSDVVCVAAADGKEQWRANLNKDFGGKTPTWGNSDSLLVDENNVYCTTGSRKGTVVALDKHTGKLVWQSKDLAEGIQYIPLVMAQIGGVTQIIASTDRTLAGLSPKDGSVLWRTPRKGRVAVIPTPIVHDNYVYVCAGYGEGENLFKIDPDAGGKFKATQVYAKKNMVNHHGGVIYVDGNVYGYSDGKGWVCQDFLTGEAKWKDKDVCGKGTLAYADGRFYLRDENKGTLVLIEANPAKVVEHGRFNQPDRSQLNAWPHLVIANGKLYVRDQDLLLCYDVKAK